MQNASHLADSQSHDLTGYIQTVGQAARKAASCLVRLDTRQKNQALKAIHDALQQQQEAILAANQMDLAAGRAASLEPALLDRLDISEARFASMLEGLAQVIGLDDPVGEITDMVYRPSGIQLGKMRVPLGVIAMIYESRPNVTIEAASLAIKSGNAIILRGGSEAFHSNQALAQAIQAGLQQAGVDPNVVQVLNTTDRAAVGQLITLRDYVDVIVPRGGKSLIERITREASIPVIKHLDGNCHVYVDDEANLEKAFAIALNAKTHRYGVCNAMETLLVNRKIAAEFLPEIAAAYREKGVELRTDPEAMPHVAGAVAATEQDWFEEYLAPVLAIKTVDDMDEAIAHINQYGSHHTDAIVTENYSRARQFLREVDSSSVMVNASTRFADGFEYGLGAEIGISTDKIHARGPVGLEGLTSQKWIVLGDGQIRQ